MTDSLITRLEAAPEGSRELDAEIVRAIGRKVERFMVPDDHPILTGGLEFMVETDGTRVGIPHYTTSIDAALTLVPEGWCGNVDFGVGERQGCGIWAPKGREDICIFGATPALALCIASLKARESDDE